MQESDVELKKDQTCGVCENVQSSLSIHLPLGATQGTSKIYPTAFHIAQHGSSST